ncbi:MAG: geranylgeranylglyceryl/heptaprenylglyceryl phosphate synthase [Leadbetterella sp.]
MGQILNNIVQAKGKKSLAVLIDPDKIDAYSLKERIDMLNQHPIDFVFVGGSLISSDKMSWVLSELKPKTKQAKIIFPGHGSHIDDQADAILLLSLISGRNPEYLIGQHVISAPALKRSKLEILPVGYILIDGGTPTTVSYISNTFPIPANKPDVAAATALAGNLLGLKIIYLDAGSGAKNAINSHIIEAVSSTIDCPLIVGGGINTGEKAYSAWKAGADIIVVGNSLETNPDFIHDIMAAKLEFAF